MSMRNGSFLERVIRAITRGTIPIDASQCDGPCVVTPPMRRRRSATARRSAISDSLGEFALTSRRARSPS